MWLQFTTATLKLCIDKLYSLIKCFTDTMGMPYYKIIQKLLFDY